MLFRSTVKFTLASVTLQQEVAAGETSIVLPKLHLPQGPATLEAVLESDSGQAGMQFVEVKNLE